MFLLFLPLQGDGEIQHREGNSGRKEKRAGKIKIKKREEKLNLGNSLKKKCVKITFSLTMESGKHSQGKRIRTKAKKILHKLKG